MDATNTVNFYSIICLKYDNAFLQSDCDWLTQVRKDFFGSGKKQKNKIIKEYSGKTYHYSYILEPDKPMRWKRMLGEKILEKSRINNDGSYDILFFDEDRFIYKIVYFDLYHNIKKIEYFGNSSNTRKKVLTLNVNKDGLFVTEYKSSINHTVSYKVYPVNLDIKNYTFEAIDNKFTAFLCLTPRGAITYSTKEQISVLESMKTSGNNIKNALNIDEKIIDNVALEEKISEINVNTEEIPTSESNTILSDISAKNDSTPKFDENIVDDVALEEKISEINVNTEEIPTSECNTILSDISAKNVAPVVNEKMTNLTYKKIVKTENGEKFYYFGEMNSNLRNGNGLTLSETGTPAYVGSYLDDKKDGLGVFCNRFGEICYIGNFNQNKKHNWGITFDKSQNKIIMKTYDNGIPVNTIAEFDEFGNILYVGKTDKPASYNASDNDVLESQLSFDTPNLAP